MHKHDKFENHIKNLMKECQKILMVGPCRPCPVLIPDPAVALQNKLNAELLKAAIDAIRVGIQR